jgi:hypothetical protein
MIAFIEKANNGAGAGAGTVATKTLRMTMD